MQGQNYSSRQPPPRGYPSQPPPNSMSTYPNQPGPPTPGAFQQPRGPPPSGQAPPSAAASYPPPPQQQQQQLPQPRGMPPSNVSSQPVPRGLPPTRQARSPGNAAAAAAAYPPPQPRGAPPVQGYAPPPPTSAPNQPHQPRGAPPPMSAPPHQPISSLLLSRGSGPSPLQPPMSSNSPLQPQVRSQQPPQTSSAGGYGAPPRESAGGGGGSVPSYAQPQPMAGLAPPSGGPPRGAATLNGPPPLSSTSTAAAAGPYGGPPKNLGPPPPSTNSGGPPMYAPPLQQQQQQQHQQPHLSPPRVAARPPGIAPGMAPGMAPKGMPGPPPMYGQTAVGAANAPPPGPYANALAPPPQAHLSRPPPPSSSAGPPPPRGGPPTHGGPPPQAGGGYPPPPLPPGGAAAAPAQPMAKPPPPAPRIDPSQIPRLLVPPSGSAFPTWSSRSLIGDDVAENKIGPPTAALPLVCSDEGNATPRHARPTLHHVPCSAELLAQTRQPLAVAFTPMAPPEEGELPVPRVVDFAHNSGDFSGGNSGSSSDGSHGPVRCQRCKAYVNCFCSWHKEGTAWVCNLCNMENPTPPWYRCPVDNFGQRADALERPELSCGSVDFNATGEYCVRPLQEPIYVFVVDCSPPAVASGFTQLALSCAWASVVASCVALGARPEECLGPAADVAPPAAAAAAPAADGGDGGGGGSGDGSATGGETAPPLASSTSSCSGVMRSLRSTWLGSESAGRVEPVLPGGAFAKVGIVAYDGKQVLFFKAGAKACANGPPLSGEHAVMADVDDPFAPLPPQEWLLPVAGEDYALQEAIAARKAAAAAAKGGRGKASSSSASSLLSGLTGNTSTSNSNNSSGSGSSGSSYPPGQLAQRPRPAAVDLAACAKAALVAGELCAWIWKLALTNDSMNAAEGGGTLSPGGLPVGCGPAALAAVANGLHECGGRVYLMNHSAPLAGLGRLRPREHPSDYGTPREAHMWRPLTPQHPAGGEDRACGEHYAKLADQCAARQVVVHVLSTDGGAYGSGGGAERRGGFGGFNDVATLSTVPAATGGSLHFYPSAVASNGNGQCMVPSVASAFTGQMALLVTSAAANEAVLKVRCSMGLRCVSFGGCGGVQRTIEELELAAVDHHTNVTCLLKHEGAALPPNAKCYLQAALLHTTPNGQRSIRVHNLCLMAASDPADVFRLADLDAIFATKLVAFEGPQGGNGLLPSLVQRGGGSPLVPGTAGPLSQSLELEAARERLTEECAHGLHGYRAICAKGSPPGQLILPESLKLWPLLTLGALKSVALRENSKLGSSASLSRLDGGSVGPDPRADERACALAELYGGRGTPSVVHRFTQPRLYDVACLDPTSLEGEACDPGPHHNSTRSRPGQWLPGSSVHVALPPLLVCSAASLGADKVLLLDAGREIFLWVGSDVDALVLRELFGVDTVSAANPPTELLRHVPPALASASSSVSGSSPNAATEEEVEQLLLLPKLHRVISELRHGLPTFAPLKIVVSGPKSVHEPRFHSLLIEDKTRHDGSYVDYLCAVHRQIQLKMT